MSEAKGQTKEEKEQLQPAADFPSKQRLEKDEQGFLVVKDHGPVITAKMVKDMSEDDVD